MTVDLPTPLLVTRHQCPHCRRFTRASRQSVQDHMRRCWRNPQARACKTCRHFQEQRESTSQCIPGRDCRCGDVPQECQHPDGPQELPQPVTDCPLWQPAA